MIDTAPPDACKLTCFPGVPMHRLGELAAQCPVCAKHVGDVAERQAWLERTQRLFRQVYIAVLPLGPLPACTPENGFTYARQDTES